MTSPVDLLYPVILAGGSGERFWPLSRRRLPKHLLTLLSDRPLVAQAVDRLGGLVPADRVMVLTNNQQVEATRAALVDCPGVAVMGEPDKRDTAPAAVLATALAARKNPQAVVALLPADAWIGDGALFRNQLADAADLALETGSLVVISLTPTHPATGFGYIEWGEPLRAGPHGSSCRRVVRFVEKPDAERAAEFCASGRFGWNAGMFVWTVEAFRKELGRLCPELAEFMDAVVRAEDPGPVVRKRFANLPKISVDYAILEKAGSVVAVEGRFPWDDVGTWTALPAHLGTDAAGNTLRGPVVSIGSEGNIVLAQGRTIALCGVKDLVVVDTGDALLVCHKDAVQDVKTLQPMLPDSLR
jgi:mannose-1-phosphate guanylyltransferase